MADFRMDLNFSIRCYDGDNYEETTSMQYEGLKESNCNTVCEYFARFLLANGYRINTVTKMFNPDEVEV